MENGITTSFGSSSSVHPELKALLICSSNLRASQAEIAKSVRQLYHLRQQIADWAVSAL